LQQHNHQTRRCCSDHIDHRVAVDSDKHDHGNDHDTDHDTFRAEAAEGRV
jgi:hypothetical protein